LCRVADPRNGKIAVSTFMYKSESNPELARTFEPSTNYHKSFRTGLSRFS
jgi:hypothetical protein